jgi:Terminase small subunit
MTKGSLTAREEAFTQAIADGLGPSEAYRQSHGSKMAPDAVASNAKRLLRRSRVKERIAGLKGEGTGGAYGLTPKQDAFCRFYLEKSNASEAYRLAYNVAPSTKPETVNRKAAELLANGKITARLDSLRAELRERNAITLDHLVEALRPIAFSDIRKVCDWGPAVPLKDPETGEVVVVQDVVVKPRADLDDAGAAMINKLVRGKDGSVRVELHDKLAAIEKIAKLLGLLKEQHEHSGSVKVQELVPQHMGDDQLTEMMADYFGRDRVPKKKPGQEGR